MPSLTITPNTKNSYISVSNATTNFVGIRVRSLNASYKYRSLIEVPITLLSTAATITAATLNLYYASWSDSDPVGRTYWAYKLSRTDWVETEATWNIYKTANNWSIAGGDYVTSGPAGGSAVVPASAGWMSFNILAIAQDAQTAVAPIEILLIDGDEVSDGTSRIGNFNNRETASNKPYVTITYTLPAPTYIAGSGAMLILP